MSVHGPIPLGLCQCGCGERTTIAIRNRKTHGHIKGEPVRYVHGHARRKSPLEYVVEDRGYETPCWIWQRGLTSGYGTQFSNGHTQKAHRVFYEREHGPIPAGLFIDHLCRTRACVNPEHLEPVTNAENCRRGLKAKLDAEAVKMIRASGKSGVDLAVAYGITTTAIYLVRSRKTWADV